MAEIQNNPMAGASYIRVDKADVLRTLRAVPDKHAPEVVKYAINLTAGDIKVEEQNTMRSVFDRPTRFTMNSLFVRPARTDNLTASVEFKQGFGSVPAWRYLGPQVDGGSRAKKSFERALERAGILKSDEFAVPGQGVTLDASGNVKGGEITRILSQLKANPEPQANATNSRRSRAARKRKGTYFVLRGQGVAAGIYRRLGNDRGILPILMFVKAPRYQPRFPFYQVADRVRSLKLAANARFAWSRVAARLQTRAAA